MRKRAPDVNKAALSAVVANTLQIALVLALMIYVFAVPPTSQRPALIRTLAVIAAGVVISGAVLDIREAVATRRLNRQLEGMTDTIESLDSLNIRLRAQRHDFLNHLQVVYSLTEMGDYAEANAYIEKVYGQITSLGRALKTAIPAVNALLQVKLAACEREGIRVDTEIRSDWEGLPMEAWEMCKVLGNLIDNAMDAVRDAGGERRILIALGEDLHRYTFRVENTGAGIPPEELEHIFEAGVTTKAEGHGMGLYIVRETLRQAGGDITVRSGDGLTVFEGEVRKPSAAG